MWSGVNKNFTTKNRELYKFSTKNLALILAVIFCEICNFSDKFSSHHNRLKYNFFLEKLTHKDSMFWTYHTKGFSDYEFEVIWVTLCSE